MNNMKLLVKWDVPAPRTDRIYVKGCMVVKSDISNIFLSNLKGDTREIGKCRIVSDDIGLWATDIEYFVDEFLLKELLEVSYRNNTSGRTGTTELSLACMATDNKIIKDATFSHVTHQLFIDVNMDEVVRDLKLSSVLL